MPSRRRLVPGSLALLLLLGACGSTPRAPDGEPGATTRPPPVADERLVRPTDLSESDLEAFRTAWLLFVMHDASWPAARDRWLERGGAAPYLLAENLFRYFWSASRANRRNEVARVAESAAAVGEPAVAYFAKALVTDRWPLREPVTQEVFNPENPRQPLTRTFTHYDIDDTTRQHAAYVLAQIGPPAVPTLASPGVLGAALPSARRYAAYALGAIGTDAAVAALVRVLRESGSWQDRGAAAKGLGFALARNASARAPLEAALQDPDPFVRRKAQEALEGRSRLEF